MFACERAAVLNEYKRGHGALSTLWPLRAERGAIHYSPAEKADREIVKFEMLSKFQKQFLDYATSSVNALILLLMDAYAKHLATGGRDL